MSRIPVSILFASLAAGCLAEPDFPEGWEEAAPVASFTRAACGDDTYLEDGDERVEASGALGTVSVSYLDAHFRCDQEVEGFQLLEGDTLSILVQPIDMDPRETARCDCLYDIELAVEDLPAGALTVDVFRRWDNLNDDNDPVFIASVGVTVE
jgi:hypothetical protein